MQSLGIDIGSRTIKTVVLRDKEIREWEVVDATSHPADTARRFLSKYRGLPVVATGYGRKLLEKELGVRITVPPNPQIVAASGAAAIAAHGF